MAALAPKPPLVSAIMLTRDRPEFALQSVPRLARGEIVAHWDDNDYRRRVWEEANFPDQSVAEDATFLDQALRMGARLRAIDAEGLFSYVRHGANAWEMGCGLTGGTAGWETVPEPDLTTDARAFYSARSAAAAK